MRRWLKRAAVSALVLGALLAIVIGACYWCIGTPQFARFITPRIAKYIGTHIDRNVTIGSIAVHRGTPYHVVVRDVHVRNRTGGAAPDFATIREIDIAIRIESVVQRRIRIDRIAIRQPQINAEINPQNLPSWKSEGESPVDVTIGTISIDRGSLHFTDHRNGIVTAAENITTRIEMRSQPAITDVAVAVPCVTTRIKDGAPFVVALKTAARFSGDVVAIQSLAIDGDDVKASATGTVRMNDASYNLRLQTAAQLDRASAIVTSAPQLSGSLAIDARISGRRDHFRIDGTWKMPKIAAGTNEITDARGKLAISNSTADVEIVKAAYAGGNFNGRYALTKFDKPYPMSATL